MHFSKSLKIVSLNESLFRMFKILVSCFRFVEKQWDWDYTLYVTNSILPVVLCVFTYIFYIYRLYALNLGRLWFNRAHNTTRAHAKLHKIIFDSFHDIPHKVSFWRSLLYAYPMWFGKFAGWPGNAKISWNKNQNIFTYLYADISTKCQAIWKRNDEILL